MVRVLALPPRHRGHRLDRRRGGDSDLRDTHQRAADPAKAAFFAQNVSWTVQRVLLPASLLTLASGSASFARQLGLGRAVRRLRALRLGRRVRRRVRLPRSRARAGGRAARHRGPGARRWRCRCATSSGSRARCSSCSDDRLHDDRQARDQAHRTGQPPARASRWVTTMRSEAAADYISGIGADGSVCQRPNSLPSGSVQVANQPMLGTGIPSAASPPSSRTRATPALMSSTSKSRPRAALAGLRVRDGRALLLAEPRHVVLDGPG